MTLEMTTYESSPATPLIRSPGVATLERLIEAGWWIEPPVLARLAWSRQNSDQLAYHFILQRGSQRSLVVIADSPELHRFLAAQALPVT